VAERIGLGTEFQREGATPGVYDTIAYVASITPPQITTDDVEVEDLDPTDAYKKYLPGLLDGGEVSLTLNFDGSSTGHTALLGDANSRATKNFKIVLPDTSTWGFSGYVKGFANSDIAAGDVIQADVTIKVTGKPTFTAA
jgi:hypothetical protein